MKLTYEAALTIGAENAADTLVVPREGLVLMAGADDPQALTRVLDQAQAAYRESENLVSLRAVWWGTQPIPSEWLPPRRRALQQARHGARLTPGAQ